jgi:hypothetical protein
MSFEPYTLWSDPDRTRHFLIPDDAELPEGDFELRTVVGRERHVTEESAAEHEVSREEAREWLKGRLGGVLDEARDTILGTLKQARRASRERTGAMLDEMAPEQRRRQADFLERFAAGLERAAARGGERLREAAGRMRREETERNEPETREDEPPADPTAGR